MNEMDFGLGYDGPSVLPANIRPHLGKYGTDPDASLCAWADCCVLDRGFVT